MSYKIAIDPTAFFILNSFLFFIFFFFFRNFTKKNFDFPHFKFSRLSACKEFSFKPPFINKAISLHYIALVCFIFALLNPYVLYPVKNLSVLPFSTEGLGIYLVLDQSGSMKESIVIKTEEDLREKTTKMAYLKKITSSFIRSHSSDLIGLVSFARVPHVLSPLTLDQKTLLKNLQQLQVVEKENEEGTAIGYAIFKTAHIIAASRQLAETVSEKEKIAYDMKNAIIIVVTDGLQNPSLLDRGNRLRTMELDDAASYAKKENIKVYVVNIDPQFAKADFEPERKQLQKITEMTGGQFFLVDSEKTLASIYETIDQLEKEPISSFDSSYSQEKLSFYPFFISIGLVFLFSALFLESFILKLSP